MKVYAPSVPITIVPTPGIVSTVLPAVNVPATPAIVNVVTVIVPSGEVKSASMTLPTFAVSSGVVVTSLLSVKLSSTAVTVIAKVDVSGAP